MIPLVSPEAPRILHRFLLRPLNQGTDPEDSKSKRKKKTTTTIPWTAAGARGAGTAPPPPWNASLHVHGVVVVVVPKTGAGFWPRPRSGNHSTFFGRIWGEFFLYKVLVYFLLGYESWHWNQKRGADIFYPPYLPTGNFRPVRNSAQMSVSLGSRSHFARFQSSIFVSRIFRISVLCRTAAKKCDLFIASS